MTHRSNEARPHRCPTCTSPDPKLHPAMQHEAEVEICKDSWHGPVTNEATPSVEEAYEFLRERDAELGPRPDNPVRQASPLDYFDMRCPECGQMMTSHVIVTRHAEGPCDERMIGPELPRPAKAMVEVDPRVADLVSAATALREEVRLSGALERWSTHDAAKRFWKALDALPILESRPETPRHEDRIRCGMRVRHRRSGQTGTVVYQPKAQVRVDVVEGNTMIVDWMIENLEPTDEKEFFFDYACEACGALPDSVTSGDSHPRPKTAAPEPAAHFTVGAKVLIPAREPKRLGTVVGVLTRVQVRRLDGTVGYFEPAELEHAHHCWEPDCAACVAIDAALHEKTDAGGQQKMKCLRCKTSYPCICDEPQPVPDEKAAS